MNKNGKIIAFILFIILTLVADTKNVQGIFSTGIINPADEAKHNLHIDKQFFSLIEYPVGALIQRKTF
jgi:hypothetical protein